MGTSNEVAWQPHRQVTFLRDTPGEVREVEYMAYADNDIIQLNARVTMADGQIAENVFHVAVLATGTDVEVEDACVGYVERAMLTVEDIMSGAVDALDILLLNLSDNAPTKVLSWDTFAGGTVASSNQLPPGVAALVTGITAVAKVVGRKFLPGLAGEFWNGSGWTTTAITALGQFAIAWIEDFTDVGTGVSLRPVVKRAGVLAVQAFTEALVRSEAAYQRRRRQGVGD